MPPPVFEEGVYMSHSTATEHAGGAAQRARSLRELEPLEGFLHSAATARPRCQRCGDVLGLFHPQVVLGVPMCSDESASAVARGGSRERERARQCATVARTLMPFACSFSLSLRSAGSSSMPSTYFVIDPSASADTYSVCGRARV